MARLFCFGLGYTARHLAAHLRARGWEIAGTCRDPREAERLRARGIAAHVFTRACPLAEPEAALKGTTHLLSSVPPDAEGDPVLDCHGADLATCAPAIRWAGYLSATGIYGDRGGAWVDEETEPAPTTERGRRRLLAERGWCALWRDHGLPVHLFRLAGIYGPRRNPLDAVRAGTARRVIKPGQVFSRIHVADIVAALLASMARPHPGRAYNVCDDLPAPPKGTCGSSCRVGELTCTMQAWA
jgi:nucleoside-diphosphate-sugar epimerase